MEATFNRSKRSFKKPEFSWEEYFSDKKREGTDIQLKSSLSKKLGKNYSIWMGAKPFLILGVVQENF